MNSFAPRTEAWSSWSQRNRPGRSTRRWSMRCFDPEPNPPWRRRGSRFPLPKHLIFDFALHFGKVYDSSINYIINTHGVNFVKALQGLEPLRKGILSVKKTTWKMADRKIQCPDIQIKILISSVLIRNLLTETAMGIKYL